MCSRYVKSVGRSPKSPSPMSATRVVTPRASTSARAAGSPNREIPHTSFSPVSVLASPKAIRPAGPVMRTFSPLSIARSLIFDPKAALPHTNVMQQTTHQALQQGLEAGLDALLAALDLERLAENRFRAAPDTAAPPGRVYGGQLLAQALVAAAMTTPGKSPLSMHAAFVRPGTPGVPLEAV